MFVLFNQNIPDCIIRIGGPECSRGDIIISQWCRWPDKDCKVILEGVSSLISIFKEKSSTHHIIDHIILNLQEKKDTIRTPYNWTK